MLLRAVLIFGLGDLIEAVVAVAYQRQIAAEHDPETVVQQLLVTCPERELPGMSQFGIETARFEEPLSIHAAAILLPRPLPAIARRTGKTVVDRIEQCSVECDGQVFRGSPTAIELNAGAGGSGGVLDDEFRCAEKDRRQRRHLPVGELGIEGDHVEFQPPVGRQRLEPCFDGFSLFRAINELLHVRNGHADAEAARLESLCIAQKQHGLVAHVPTQLNLRIRGRVVHSPCDADLRIGIVRNGHLGPDLAARTVIAVHQPDDLVRAIQFVVARAVLELGRLVHLRDARAHVQGHVSAETEPEIDETAQPLGLFAEIRIVWKRRYEPIVGNRSRSDRRHPAGGGRDNRAIIAIVVGALLPIQAAHPLERTPWGTLDAEFLLGGLVVIEDRDGEEVHVRLIRIG